MTGLFFFFGRKKFSGAATTPRGNFARIDLAMRYFGEMFLFSPFVTRVSHQWHTPRDVKTSTTWGTGVKCHAISWCSEELADVLLHSVRTLNVNFIGRVLSATFWGITPWIGDDEQELFSKMMGRERFIGSMKVDRTPRDGAIVANPHWKGLAYRLPNGR